MSDFFKSLSISASGMAAQAKRLNTVSQNIANVDTAGYKRKTMPFSSQNDGRVRTGNVQLDQRPLEKIYDPSHALADDTGHYDGSNVNLLTEIADAREAQRSYEANLKLFDQARQMSANLMELLKK